MDDQNTTTDDESVDTGAEALPETQSESAEEVTSESTEDSSEGADAAQPETDDKLKKFADSKGISLDTESEIKSAKIALNSQQEFTRKRQTNSKLEKAMDEGITQEVEARGLSDDDRVDIARLKAKMTVRDFWDSNPDAKTYEPQMVKILQSKPHLAGDLESLFAVALRDGGNTETLKSEGGRRALESLASKQRATSPTGSAISSAPSSKTITRAEINQHLQAGDTAWYNKNQTKINQLVAEGKLQ